MAMKTTLNLDDELLLRAKKLAQERGATLTSIVEGALRDALIAASEPAAYEFRWVTTKGRKRPSIDPADRNALYDFLEDRPS